MKTPLQLLVIKSYPKATKPIPLSKILQHLHKLHPSQYLCNIQKSQGWWRNKTKRFVCVQHGLQRIQSSCRQRPAALRRGLPRAPRAGRTGPGAPCAARTGRDSGRRAALLAWLCRPRFPTDQARELGGGGEFHKVNPENTEGVGGGESNDSPRMFSSKRHFSLLQQQNSQSLKRWRGDPFSWNSQEIDLRTRKSSFLHSEKLYPM